jgi:glycosyltransferase involved in cell wall biosynthesis
MTVIPGVTAIITTYNRANHLQEAFDSILQQTVPVSKVVIIDDGSADNTEMICQSLILKNEIPIVYRRFENSGAPASRNRGLDEVNTTYTAFLDDDDLWQTDHIERCLMLFKKYPGAVSVGGLIIRDENREVVITSNKDVFEDYERVHLNEFIRKKGPVTRRFYSTSLAAKVFRSDTVKAIRFDEDMKLRDDVLISWQIGELGDTIFEKYPHARAKQLEHSLSSFTDNAPISVRYEIDLQRTYYVTKIHEKIMNGKNRKDCPLLFKSYGQSLFNYTYALVMAKKYKEAWIPYLQSLKYTFTINHLKLLVRLLLTTVCQK